MNLIAKSILFCTLIAIQIQNISNAPNDPIVTTKLGKILGTVKTLDDGKTAVNLFYGIRYGKAPIGELRFRKSLPEPKWEGIYNATKMKYSCPQTGGSTPNEAPINEDCLFLSVWQPNKTLAKEEKRSVMMFIYGGSFSSGTEFSFAYDSRWLAALGDVIVVTINYRLGPFGFLYSGNDEAPGNAGLYDQILALKWIKDNIEAFGGDPDTITIFGESAGSMSVGALVVSPLTEGLFKRAILQSGSPMSPLLGSSSKCTQLDRFDAFANKMNCYNTDVSETMACLRAKTVSEILNITSHFDAILTGLLFDPTYEDELLPIKPYDALKAGQFNKNLDVLVGTNRDEGSIFVESVFINLSPEKNFTISVGEAEEYILLIFAALGKTYSQEVADFYLKDLKQGQTVELLRAVSASLGDYVLVCPTILTGEQLAKSDNSSKVFAYRLTHTPAVSAMMECKGWMGVCHADDIIFLFGFPIALRGIPFTEDDYKLSEDMIRVWTTFAKTGSPPALNGIQWPEAIDRNEQDATVKHMQLDPNDYKVVENSYKENCDKFWKPKLIQ